MYVKEKKHCECSYKQIADQKMAQSSAPFSDGAIQSRILSISLENRSTVQIFQHTGSFNGRIQTIHIQWQNI